VFSLNANGLVDMVKRQAVFQKKKGPGIFLLQETHSTVKTSNKFIEQWGNKNIIFAHGTSNSKGVAILFSNNFEYELIREEVDTEGRFLIIDVKINNKMFTIANIYAPTRNFQHEQIIIFKKLQDGIQLFTLENTIIGGDLNLYLNPRLDKLDAMPDTNDNPDYRKNIISFMETEDLVDIWRLLNPYSRIFTWYRGKARSRLDYFLTSEHLLNFVQKVDIQPGFH
jgi:exonuclease III